VAHVSAPPSPCDHFFIFCFFTIALLLLLCDENKTNQINDIAQYMQRAPPRHTTSTSLLCAPQRVVAPFILLPLLSRTTLIFQFLPSFPHSVPHLNLIRFVSFLGFIFLHTQYALVSAILAIPIHPRPAPGQEGGPILPSESEMVNKPSFTDRNNKVGMQSVSIYSECLW